MFYTELTFHISPYVEDIADAIIAELGDLGYDSFSYSDDGFKAYIPSKNFDEEQVKSLEILHSSKHYTRSPGKKQKSRTKIGTKSGKKTSRLSSCKTGFW